MKNFYIAVQVEENGKYSAAVIPVTESTNIYRKLADIPGIVAANIFTSRAAAARTVYAWVDGFRGAGVYMWDTMPDGSPAPF